MFILYVTVKLLYIFRQTGKDSMLTKKGQSALEYMMTYGWAILIIVIVAVILYSMGIFNPSSSVTFTSSGFSPFTVSSTLCTQDGLSFAVLAGPLPGSATSAKITKVFISSATGANTTSLAFTLPSAITLTSGSTADIIIPSIACKASGVKLSMSVLLQYSTVGGPLPQTLNATGTLAGTSTTGSVGTLTTGPTLPTGIEYYSQITVTNIQSTATPTPFQQMVNVSSSVYDGSYANLTGTYSFQNVEFFYQNGTVIPSWLESYTANHALFWLKLGSIPAFSSITVYMGFAPTTTNLFNKVNDGEAPQLSSTYGEYDDGENVFDIYINGNTPLSDFNILSSITATQTTATYSNGNKINIISLTGVIYTREGILSYDYKSLPNTGYIQYSSFQAPSSSDSNGEPSNGLGNSPTASSINYFDGDIASSTVYFGLQYVNNGAWGDNIVGTGTTSWQIDNFSYPGPSISTVKGCGEAAGYNYCESADNYLDSSSNLYASLYYADADGVNLDENINWWFTAGYPPNGVMPSVTFGSVS